MPSDTDTNINDGTLVDEDIWSAMDALMLLQLTMKSALWTEDEIYDVQGAFFKVPARLRCKNPILFGRCETDYMIFIDETEPSEYKL